MINSYSFGKIVVEGKTYEEDVIISEEGVKSHWWRKKGHELCLDDMKDVLPKKPKLLIVGTGHDGMMQVLDEVRDYCREKGIKLVEEFTKDAVKTYNGERGDGVFALLHLTC